MSTVRERVYAVAWFIAAALFAYGLYDWLVHFDNKILMARFTNEAEELDIIQAMASPWWLSIDLPKWFIDFAYVIFPAYAGTAILLTLPLPLLILGRRLVTGRWQIRPWQPGAR